MAPALCIAPSFGADDFKVARDNGIGSLIDTGWQTRRFLPEVQGRCFSVGEEFVKEATSTILKNKTSLPDKADSGGCRKK